MRKQPHSGVRIVKSTIYIEVDLTMETVADIYDDYCNYIILQKNTPFVVDLSKVQRIDSAGVALLDEIHDSAKTAGCDSQIVNAAEAIGKFIVTFGSNQNSGKSSVRHKESLLERMGSLVYRGWLNIYNFSILVADTTYFSIYGLFHKGKVRKGEFIKQCVLIGMNALPIVALISFLIGFILALQSAAQLRQFGASIFVADLVAISMTREMGPIMTAIVLAGRSGSAIASEIANMVVTEETDALKTMGLDPIQFVVVPRVHAIAITTPMLTIMSMLIGIFGSLIIGVTYLHISIRPFLNEVANVLIFKDIAVGLLKSMIFAGIIVNVGAYYGFRVRGGAEGVGRATTASVVTSIFLVILVDSLVGLIFYF